MISEEIVNVFHTKGEWDGYYYVIYFGNSFFNILKDVPNLRPYSDIICAFLNVEGDELSFMIYTADDSDAVIVTLDEFPANIQKDIINYIKNY